MKNLKSTKKYHISPSGKKSLCSGYGVYPDGTKCTGCMDCKGKPVSQKQALQAFERNHLILTVDANTNIMKEIKTHVKKTLKKQNKKHNS